MSVGIKKGLSSQARFAKLGFVNPEFDVIVKRKQADATRRKGNVMLLSKADGNERRAERAIDALSSRATLL
jgi:hypothetical protein